MTLFKVEFEVVGTTRYSIHGVDSGISQVRAPKIAMKDNTREVEDRFQSRLRRVREPVANSLLDN
jgi:hypothetical protein